MINPILSSHYEIPVDAVFQPSPLSYHHSLSDNKSSSVHHHPHSLKRPSLPNHYPYVPFNNNSYQQQQQRSHYYDESDISQLRMVPPLSLPIKNNNNHSSLSKNQHYISQSTSPISPTTPMNSQCQPTLLSSSSSPWTNKSYFPPLDFNSHHSTWSMNSTVVKSSPSNSIMSA